MRTCALGYKYLEILPVTSSNSTATQDCTLGVSVSGIAPIKRPVPALGSNMRPPLKPMLSNPLYMARIMLGSV